VEKEISILPFGQEGYLGLREPPFQGLEEWGGQYDVPHGTQADN